MGLIILLFDIMEGILSAIIEVSFDCLKTLFSTDRKTEFDAQFLPSSEILSTYKRGFCLTGRKSLSIADSFKNALVIGSTGNYKSSGVLIPSILKMRGHSSLIITDFSGELLRKTSGALLKAGYSVRAVNYGNPDLSEGYNPL